MANENFVFVLDDKLPTMYDAAIAIYSVSKRNIGETRNADIHAYAVELQRVWIAAFGEEFVFSLNGIKKKFTEIMKSYYNNVQVEAARKTDKLAGAKKASTSIRQLNKVKNKELPQKKHSKKPQCKITYSCLFDIGKNMEKLTGMKRYFTEMQNIRRD